MPAFSSCRQSTSGFSRSRNSHTCAARARMPFTFQVAIFMNRDSPYVFLGAFDDFQLVVYAFDAIDLAGDLRRAAALLLAVDGAPQAHFAVGGGDVDRRGRQLRVLRFERLLHLAGELLVRIGLRRLGLG